MFQNFDVWTRQNIMLIAMAQIATLLVIFGEQINAMVHRLVRPYPFMARIAAFVALCAFGYGALTAVVTPLYAELIAKLNQMILLPALLVSFILIGMLAEHGVKRR
ncbi:MAG: DUF3392 domain-containing protein [Gammaproteobacteria bacterium]|nr:DUF3392 domain-containing protein [Gammaproteobacteria bacterium]MDH5728627.1 DUF3392 domain-containing protein [Gammaproteobacteria bacterium]